MMLGVQDDEGRNKLAHQVNSVYIWVLCHVFSYSTMFHPIANDFQRQRLGESSKERNDVLVL